MSAERYTPNQCQSVADILSDWPDKPKQEAKTLMDKYGEPNEATPSMLVWYNNGPWKRTVLHRDVVQHDFPAPHPDFLEMTIDYKVPADRVGDLSELDGSLSVERTRGEMTSACNAEGLNMLIINSAHDVITGKKTIDEARQEIGKDAMSFMMHRSTPYTESLQFHLPKGDTKDPGKSIVGESAVGLMKEEASKATEAVKRAF